MNADTEMFLRALFGGVEQGYVTLTAIHPTRTRASPSRHIPLGDEESLQRSVEALCLANQRGWDAFVGIAIRQTNLGRWRRGGRGDLHRLPALFADLDTLQSYQRLATIHLPPSCVVHSGHGWHVYWFIQLTDDWELAERTLSGLRQWLGADKVTVAQSLRLPGTLNHKYGQPTVRCELVALHPQWRYLLADFAPYALAPPTPGTSPSPKPQQDDLMATIVTCLIQHYGGFFKPNGWLAAKCPLGHRYDYPGSHFNLHPRGIAHCFGKHGTIPIPTLREILHL